MMLRIPIVYPLTDKALTGLSHSEQVRRLAAGGATFIQLREKYLSTKDFYAEAETALKVARELNVKLVINDRVDIALALEADGVHLGQDDLSPEAARQLLGPGAIIGVSTHNLSQAIEASQSTADYVAFGPIFSTDTKSDTSPVVGLECLSTVREVVVEKPLVAIGGIDHSNATDVLRHGADSVAVISCLLSQPDAISERTSQLMSVNQR